MDRRIGALIDLQIASHDSKHGTMADGSGGLGLIGIDLFAPNDLSLQFFTVGPFNG
jgi:hypothetical protein